MVIAGGGTGGHLFPAVAIAQEFMARNPENAVLFVSTGRPLDKTVLAETGFVHTWIAGEGIKGRGRIRQMKALAKIPKGVIQSFGILRRFKPDLVTGVGSYVAGPVLLAAWFLGLTIVLHEQNLVPGITNRVLAPLAGRIYVSFEKTGQHFNPEKVVVTGNPVRKNILESVSQRKSSGPGSDEKAPFTVLIIGGSQGAHRINLAIIEAISRIKDQMKDQAKEKNKFRFVHQTGTADFEAVIGSYRRHGFSHTVQPFFYDMENHYQQADLVVCRAGATTVAEITAMGKGAILIPYPHAADNHQVINARALTDTGAAEMILEKDMDGKALADRIQYYATHSKALRQMADNAKTIGRPDAAKTIVDDMYRLVLNKRRRGPKKRPD